MSINEESFLATAKSLLAEDLLLYVRREYDIVKGRNIVVMVGSLQNGSPICGTIVEPVENEELRAFIEKHANWTNKSQAAFKRLEEAFLKHQEISLDGVEK